MKLTLTNRTAAVVLTAITALTASTPVIRAADAAVPGLGYQLQSSTPLIDPVTGLPSSPQTPAWKDPNWKDPEKVLADVSYDGLPLAEVARDLRKQFKDAFDVLMPSSGAAIDVSGTAVTMQLKNVTASEVFNAMNVVFEIENSPLRWELQMNGKRPIAVVRVTPAFVPAPQLPLPEPPRRMIFFVGDLVGDEKSGGLPIEKLLATVEEIYQLSYGSTGGVLRFHKDAQLLIITGTVDQIDFVQQTLVALREKAQLKGQTRTDATKPKPKTDGHQSPNPH